MNRILSPWNWEIFPSYLGILSQPSSLLIKRVKSPQELSPAKPESESGLMCRMLQTLPLVPTGLMTKGLCTI